MPNNDDLSLFDETTFGGQIIVLRNQRGMTETDLADAIETLVRTTEEFGVKDVERWEKCSDVPTEEMFKVLGDILIDENPEIAQERKAELRQEFAKQYQQACTFLDGSNKSVTAGVARRFGEFITDRREELKITRAALAEELCRRTIVRPTEDKNAITFRYIAEIQAGHRPSHGFALVALEALKQTTGGGKVTLSEQQSADFMAAYDRIPKPEDAEPVRGAASAGVKAGRQVPETKAVRDLREELFGMFTHDGALPSLVDMNRAIDKPSPVMVKQQIYTNFFGRPGTLVYRLSADALDEAYKALSVVLQTWDRVADVGKFRTAVESLKKAIDTAFADAGHPSRRQRTTAMSYPPPA